MDCKMGLFNHTPFRLIGQCIKRNIHFPFRTRTRDFYFSADVKSIIQLGCANTNPHTHNHDRAFMEAKMISAGEGGEREEGRGSHGGSGAGVSCFCTKSPSTTHHPPPPLTLIDAGIYFTS